MEADWCRAIDPIEKMLLRPWFKIYKICLTINYPDISCYYWKFGMYTLNFISIFDMTFLNNGMVYLQLLISLKLIQVFVHIPRLTREYTTANKERGI